VNPEAIVQRQLDAYNARDLTRFVAEYSDQIRVFRPPTPTAILEGKQAFSDFYATKRFNLPNLHAEILNRMVIGTKVIDHERVLGMGENPQEVAVVYEIDRGFIQCVWLFSGELPLATVPKDPS